MQTEDQRWALADFFLSGEGKIVERNWIKNAREKARTVAAENRETAEELVERIDELALDLACFYHVYRQALEDKAPAGVRTRLVKWYQPEASEREIQDLTSRLRAVLPPEPWEDRLSEDSIQKARAYPIYDLLGVAEGAYVLCPFHEDKRPSFWTKGGRGYCFSCNKTCDSIGYLMQKDGLSFKNAVKRLHNRL